MANRLSTIRNAIKSELGEINGLNVLDTWSIDKWMDYDFDYVFVRTSEGENLEPVTIYQDGTFKRCESNLSIGIYIGYKHEDSEVGVEQIVEKVRQKLTGFWIPSFSIDENDEREDIECNPIVPVAWTGSLRENQFGLVYYSFTLNTTITSL